LTNIAPVDPKVVLFQSPLYVPTKSAAAAKNPAGPVKATAVVVSAAAAVVVVSAAVVAAVVDSVAALVAVAADVAEVAFESASSSPHAATTNVRPNRIVAARLKVPSCDVKTAGYPQVTEEPAAHSRVTAGENRFC
jgi:hypothetical protein